MRLSREATLSISPTKKEEAAMSQNKLPEGWDDGQLLRVLAHYDGQTKEEALLEDEAGGRPSETIMTVPRDLVPEVRELIAKRRR